MFLNAIMLNKNFNLLMKKLVVYYSFDGNTRFVAHKLAKEFGTDLLELKPVQEIPEKEPLKHFWGGRQVIMGETPELEVYTIDPEEYDLIFIGTPVWAFTFTPSIRSFLKKHKIKNKKMVLFSTHQGMPGRALKHLKKELADNEILAEISFKGVLKNPERNLRELDDFINNLKIS